MRNAKKLLLSVLLTALSAVLLCGCLGGGAASLSVDLDGMSIHIGDKGTAVFDAGYKIDKVTDSNPKIPGKSYTAEFYSISKDSKKTGVSVCFANYSTNKKPAKECSIYEIRIACTGTKAAVNGVALSGMSPSDAVTNFTNWGFKFDEADIKAFQDAETYYLSGKKGNYKVQLQSPSGKPDVLSSIKIEKKV